VAAPAYPLTEPVFPLASRVVASAPPHNGSAGPISAALDQALSFAWHHHRASRRAALPRHGLPSAAAIAAFPPRMPPVTLHEPFDISERTTTVNVDAEPMVVWRDGSEGGEHVLYPAAAGLAAENVLLAPLAAHPTSVLVYESLGNVLAQAPASVDAASELRGWETRMNALYREHSEVGLRLASAASLTGPKGATALDTAPATGLSKRALTATLEGHVWTAVRDALFSVQRIHGALTSYTHSLTEFHWSTYGRFFTTPAKLEAMATMLVREKAGGWGGGLLFRLWPPMHPRWHLHGRFRRPSCIPPPSRSGRGCCRRTCLSTSHAAPTSSARCWACAGGWDSTSTRLPWSAAAITSRA